MLLCVHLQGFEQKVESIMYIILWIVFGGIVGWIASIITHNNHRMGLLANVLVGLVGAFIGGYVAHGLGGTPIDIFSFWGMVYALIGAVIFLFVANLLRGSRSR